MQLFVVSRHSGKDSFRLRLLVLLGTGARLRKRKGEISFEHADDFEILVCPAFFVVVRGYDEVPIVSIINNLWSSWDKNDVVRHTKFIMEETSNGIFLSLV